MGPQAGRAAGAKRGDERWPLPSLAGGGQRWQQQQQHAGDRPQMPVPLLTKGALNQGGSNCCQQKSE